MVSDGRTPSVAVRAMNQTEYLEEDNWTGSYYEIGLELAPYGDDAAVTRALEVVWRQPELQGPWLE
jgi:hypothetical protein